MRIVIKGTLILICLLLICSCSIRTYKDAKVLSINNKILRGELIGNFLSSADGQIQDDAIVVGIQVEFKSKMFLIDIKLTHAEAAYYKDRDTLPMQWQVTSFFNHIIEGRLNGRVVTEISLSPNLAKKLYNEFKHS
jgi:hypothetical protein